MNENKLAKWCYEQDKLFYHKKLSKDKINKLKEIDFPFGAYYNIKFENWFKKNKKDLISLKRSYERETDTKISLRRFAEITYKETKGYKK